MVCLLAASSLIVRQAASVLLWFVEAGNITLFYIYSKRVWGKASLCLISLLNTCKFYIVVMNVIVFGGELWKRNT